MNHKQEENPCPSNEPAEEATYHTMRNWIKRIVNKYDRFCRWPPQSVLRSLEEAGTMAVNISGLRRNIKNVAHNYTDAQARNEPPFNISIIANFQPLCHGRWFNQFVPDSGQSKRGDFQWPMGPIVNHDVRDSWSYLQCRGLLRDNADDMETVERPRQKLATCV